MTRPRHRASLVLAAIVLSAASAAAQQLPADVLPDQYELRFTFDLQHDTFAGSEQILVEILKPTTRITLNAAGLTFGQVTIASESGSQPATVALDERRQTATLTVRRRLRAGPARIRIEYTGRLGTQPRGLFVGRSAGHKFAASQFEPTDARRAYPCFDQPDMKASFLLTVVAPAGDLVISNGRALSDTPGPDPAQHTVRFATTRKMSTYLVAIAVGGFECLEARSDPVPLRVCSLGGKKELGQFGLDAARSFMRFYDGYFAVKYPFTKLDLVALPDFPGGMENVGAIFFGERGLLVEPRSAPLRRQKEVAETISHEIAHQWLGDLVTMKWWNDLWLKEGFATFFQWDPVAAWKPEWHVELDEVASAEEGMAADEVRAAHAARTTVTTPAEINDLYDAIVYQKAGAVLRMVEGAMGREEFRAGVNRFLKRFAYANASAEDFRAAMSEDSVRAADEILRTFVEQPGVPVVGVASRCVTGATSSLTLAQQRFWIDPKDAPSSTAVWAIPVSARSIAAPPGVPAVSTPRLLTAKEQAFDLAGCSSLVVANARSTGYFRTRYPVEVLAALTREVPTALTPVERLRLLDDQWAIARAGGIEIGQYLSLLSGYGSEQDDQIVRRAAETLRVIDADVADGSAREAFDAWLHRALPSLAAALDSPVHPDPLDALTEALSDGGQAADVGALLGAAVRNGTTRTAAWSFMKSHWRQIVAKVGADQAVTAVVNGASGFCDPGWRDQAKAFLQPQLGDSRALAQLLEQIQGCVNFSASQRENLAHWLAAQATAPPSPSAGPTPPGSR